MNELVKGIAKKLSSNSLTNFMIQQKNLVAPAVAIGVLLGSTQPAFAKSSINQADVTHAIVANEQDAEQVKIEIIALAQTFTGQGDPDFRKQHALDVLVNKLLALRPQPPIKDRLSSLYGPWQQVWGPYEYRKNDRSVDPTLGVDEIYQVVFPGGYYYNVSPNYKNGDRSKERIGLLRGEFKLDSREPNTLRVQFTKSTRIPARINGKNLWDLAELSEARTLPNEQTTLPSWLVKILLGGGALREVYTDQDLRIAYGSNGKAIAKEALYVLVRP